MRRVCASHANFEVLSFQAAAEIWLRLFGLHADDRGREIDVLDNYVLDRAPDEYSSYSILGCVFTCVGLCSNCGSVRRE